MAPCAATGNNAAVAKAKRPLVYAAGGVVVRHRKKGRQVVVVHRPSHDDWSLPKGKLDTGETWQKAALREVLEETAVKARITHMLEPTSYLVSGKPKIVVWFRMDPIERGKFRPNGEVDKVRWVWAADLADLLTHETDLRVAREALGI